VENSISVFIRKAKHHRGIAYIKVNILDLLLGVGPALVSAYSRLKPVEDAVACRR